MRCLVTGAAGFIGSHLCEKLLDAGYEVSGLDNFDPYYSRQVKESNLVTARQHPNFQFYELDLTSGVLAPALEGVETIFHLAARPGLLRSWSEFDCYMQANLQATQRLLEAIRQLPNFKQFIQGSTSSIYGAEANEAEEATPHPVSPYGLTKLAAEHLCQSYATNFDLPLSILRFFSVYGPRQRPDMGYHIFIERISTGQFIKIFGDGQQRRGSTYVGDIIEAIYLAHHRFEPGSIYNIGGGEETSALQVVQLIEEIIGRSAQIEFGPVRPGEQSRALANTTRAREKLGFVPQWGIRAGLEAQVAWQLKNKSHEISR